MKYATPGEPIRIEATPFNDALDAGQDYTRRKRNTLSGNLTGEEQDGTLVLVQNNSGYNRDRFDVLGIDGPIITPSVNFNEFANRVMVAGSTPVLRHVGKFVVLQEAIPAGGIGRAIIADVSWARVLVGYTASAATTAGPIYNDATKLEAGITGAQILWRESGYGTKWALVRISESSTGQPSIEYYDPGLRGNTGTGVSGNKIRADTPGYLYFDARIGSEADVGISHLPTYVDGSTGINSSAAGNFVFTKAGFFRLYQTWVVQNNGDTNAYALTTLTDSGGDTVTPIFNYYNNWWTANCKTYSKRSSTWTELDRTQLSARINRAHADIITVSMIASLDFEIGDRLKLLCTVGGYGSYPYDQQDGFLVQSCTFGVTRLGEAAGAVATS